MIDSKYRISLDVNSTTSNVRLKCKRGDTGRTIYAALTESGYPYHITDDCYAVFTATKPDGKKVYNGCKIEGCMIVYELTPQTVAVPGLVKCEIKLYGANDKLITSASFLLEVHDSQINDGDELESENEVEALTHLISQATGMTVKLEALPDFGSGAKVGDYLMVAEIDEKERMVKVIPVEAPSGSGSGETGKDGVDGGYYTPVVTQISENTVNLSFAASKEGMDDVAGQQIVLPAGKDGKDGKDGADGEPGKDGYTPQKGIDYFDGNDGQDGQDGSPGADGVSPHVGSNGNWFIGENDTGIPATGPTGNTGLPGTPGEDGKDGVSVTHSWSGTVLTVTSASGTSSVDLKGEPGNPGKDGSPGSAGKDGTSVSHSWNGTTLSVTSASGTSSADLKGDKGDTGSAGTSVTVKTVSESTADGGSNVVTFSDGKTITIKNGSKGSAGATGATGGKGADGKTPVRGTDYWTEADKADIVRQVLASMATPVAGIVDENNNIIITGELPDGAYKLRYEYADGTAAEIGTLNISSGPAYTNLADPTSAEWLTNKRINSSKNIVDVTEAQRGDKTVVVTNFISIAGVSKLHIKGLDIVSDLVNGSSTQNYGRVYDYAGATIIGSSYSPKGGINSKTHYTYADYDSGVLVFDIATMLKDWGGSHTSATHVRLGGILTGAAEDVIITADEKIV